MIVAMVGVLKSGACLTIVENTYAKERIDFIIKDSKAKYNDDGVETEVVEGDVTICEDGHSHSITNVSDEELKIVAMVLYK